MRVLLVEPYHGGSHGAWADGYAAASRHEVTSITHAARFWKWRMHGAHLTLARQAAEVFGDGPPDVVIASSMMDVAGFAGAARLVLGDAPLVVYFHENQFSYPLSERDRPDLTYPMINWSSAATADVVVFNSEFHRRDFLDGARRFLRQFPDHRHGPMVADVEARSVVLPVGVDLARLGGDHAPTGDPPLVLWNQRWEHDKDPDLFVRAVSSLRDEGLRFRLAVAGERFVSIPTAFEELPGTFGDDLVWFGHAPEDVYVELLRRADIVVSTARHEFFGVAVVEAIAAGAFPILPDRLVYPERIPADLAEVCLYDDETGLVERLRAAVADPGLRSRARSLPAAMRRFDWSAVAPRYDDLLERIRRDPPANADRRSPGP